LYYFSNSFEIKSQLHNTIISKSVSIHKSKFEKCRNEVDPLKGEESFKRYIQGSEKVNFRVPGVNNIIEKVTCIYIQRCCSPVSWCCFQYPVKTTVFTVSRKSFRTGCSNLTSMFLYVVIFQQMTCFLAVRTSPNMVGLTVKNIIIKNQLKQNFKVPGVLFSELSQCGLAGVLMFPLKPYLCMPHQVFENRIFRICLQ
jgi:hypothetical protein